MTWRVISPRKCRESAQVLQEQLNSIKPIEEERVINWGNSIVSLHSPANLFGNKLEAVGRSSNKARMFDLLKGLGTVPIITRENAGEFDGCFVHFDPLGQNGSGITYNTQCIYEEGVLKTGKIPGDEYRAYFAYGEVGAIYRKVRVEGNSSHPVHNSVNGWGYETNPKTLRTVRGLRGIVQDYTIKAANRLELSYGAVDFIYGTDGYVYILETNSAPTLIESSLVLFFAEKIVNHVYGE